MENIYTTIDTINAEIRHCKNSEWKQFIEKLQQV